MDIDWFSAFHPDGELHFLQLFPLLAIASEADSHRAGRLQREALDIQGLQLDVVSRLMRHDLRSRGQRRNQHRKQRYHR